MKHVRLSLTLKILLKSDDESLSANNLIVLVLREMHLGLEKTNV